MRRFKKQISTMMLVFFMCSFILPALPAEAAEDWVWPVEGFYKIGATFTGQATINKKSTGLHNGIDIIGAGIYGQNVYATRDGVVTCASDIERPYDKLCPNCKWDGQAGTHVEIDHKNGYYSVYCHLSSLAVEKGQEVQAGQIIGRVGDTGNSQGSHLHFIIAKNNYRWENTVDPLSILTNFGIPISIQNTGVTNITETTATLNAKVFNNYQRVTETGCYLGTDANNLTQKISNAVNINAAYTNVWYPIPSEFQVNLEAGTTYYYKFYAVVDGKTYEGSVDSFTTTGRKAEKPITIDSIAAGKVTDNSAIVTAIVRNQQHEVMALGCEMGTDPNNLNYSNMVAQGIDTKQKSEIWLEYSVPADFSGLQLQPNTKYYFRFWAGIEGKRYESKIDSFTTAGKPVTPVKPPVAENSITIKIDGKVVTTPVSPVIENGTTLVPLRVVSENLGAKVGWEEDTRTVVIEKDDLTIRLQIGNKIVNINNSTSTTLAVAPQIKDGTTMVPLRFVSEMLGCDVQWDNATRVISITSNEKPAKPPVKPVSPSVAMNQGQKISTSSWHAMVVKNDGTLWSWGDNLNGRLGTGAAKPGSVNTPVQVNSNVKSVSASGFRHCMLVKNDGTLWGWGDNGHGELGIGNTTNQTTPVKVMDNVGMVSAGQYHTAAVKKDGSLWVWGYNRYGSVGNGSTENVLSPVKIMDNVIMVSAGDKSTFAVTQNGDLYAWGMDNAGKLGNGHKGTQKGPDGNIIQTKPVKIMSDVVYVNAGINHNAAIKKDGSLWTWGGNNDGQLGTGVEDKSSYVPIKVLDNVASVQCSDNNTLAVKKDGSLWIWGKNDSGQLKNGNKTNVLSPQKVMDGVKEADLGYGFVAVIKTDGSVYTWGANGHGQLGSGDGKSTTSPVKVLNL